MSERLKQSQYNHFVELGNDKRLAFNAISCGLAELDDETYQKLQAIGNGSNSDSVDEELLKNFKMGNFLIPEDMDEFDLIRANHYMARFGNRGFGLTIIPTHRCNFACDYCYESSELHSAKPSAQTDMSDEVCNNIVKLCEDRIPEKAAFTVTWYGGEPLLAKDIIGKLTEQFVRICDTKKSQYHAGIITNGYLLSQENLDFLIKSRVTFAQVTVDGPREVHDKRRCIKGGGGTYDRIMANLANIRDDTPLTVGIRVNVDKRNIESVPTLLEDLKSRGLHDQKNFSVHFGHVFHTASSCPDISSQCMVTPQFAGFLVDAYKMAIDLGFRQTGYPSHMFGSCGAVGSGSAVIEPNGNVQSCWETVGHEDKKTGVLGPNGIKFSDNYMNWMGWTPFRPECLDCAVLPLCMGGCPYVSIYKEEALQNGRVSCISLRYNLKQMLPLMKLAKERNLLAVSKEHNESSKDTKIIEIV